MGPEVISGLLGGVLFASVLLNVVQHLMLKGVARQSAVHIREANDRARAAELRAEKQIDTMLDRISTEPRIELRTVDTLPPLGDEKPYISDLQYDDEHWNDTVGEIEEPEA